MAISPELARLEEIERPFSIDITVTPSLAYIVNKDFIAGALTRQRDYWVPDLLVGHHRDTQISRVEPTSSTGLTTPKHLSHEYGVVIAHIRPNRQVFIGEMYEVDYKSHQGDRLSLVIRSARAFTRVEEINGRSDFRDRLRFEQQRR